MSRVAAKLSCTKEQEMALNKLARSRTEKTRYRAGMPRVNDGALLFLQTMLGKMKPAEQGGMRVPSV